MKLRFGCVAIGLLSLAPSLAGQTSGGRSSAAQVPPLIQFSNVATDVNGKPLTGMVGVTFYLYKDQQGGSPLWMETQNIQPDKTGHYTVLLGSATSQGLPASIFVSGEAHWLGVQVQGLEEQPRVLLVSAPYALKAGDAETVGGLPASAFVLATPTLANAPNSGSNVGAGSDVGATALVSGSGTTDFVPLWTNDSVLGNSVLFQSGSGSTVAVGINTITPAATLDVNGNVISRGPLQLPSTGTATAGAGFNSQPFLLQGSSFNSGTQKAIGPVFQWQTEPSGNNTSNATGTLNLLYGSGSGSPVETGLNIASSGKITFATGQTFPGAGTITGVTTASGSGLTGGGTSGTLNLALTNTCAANQILQWSGSAWVCTTIGGGGTITGVTAGTDLTGGGSSGNVTLNLDTTKVPQLNTANTFTGNQTVNGNLTGTNVTATQTVAGGVVNATTGFDIGGIPFAFGSIANQNAFLGFAGNATMTGTGNTASGYQALSSNTAGNVNTASGYQALYSNSAGGFNTASGYQALYSNTTGGNTASGYQALYSNTTGGFNTASGYSALISNTTGGNNTASGATALFYNTTGGNNTATGTGALQSNTTGGNNTASGYQALISNTTGVSNTATGIQALDSNSTGNGNTATGDLALYSNTTAGSNTADGGGALQSNTTGDHNTASGIQALNLNTTGAQNTASGASALLSNTTGGQNTAVGYEALDGNITGSDLTCIGFACTADDGLSNATAIGAHAVVGASNALVLGGTGAYAVRVGIGTTNPSSVLTIAQGAGHPVSDGWETFSSRRWKTNIQTLHGALGKVEQLRGVSYDLKANGKHEMGVIAEEVGAVVPELVSYEANGKDARSVDYSRLTALLIEATKEQQRAFRQEQAELAKALRQIKQQQNLLRAQSAAMRSLKAEVRETRESLRKVDAQVNAAQPALVAAK